MNSIRLDSTERALLAAFRRQRTPAGLTQVEQQLIATWRNWQEHPASRPLWAIELRQQLGAEPTPAPESGLADAAPDVEGRLLGLLLGGAAAEFRALGRVGQRTSALLFVLEGLIRAHTRLRMTGEGDPLAFAVSGLRRWLHSRGVPWRDCGGDKRDGWLIGEPALWSRSVDEPTMITAMARIAAGRTAGTRQDPINSANSATSVPLGALAALWSADLDNSVQLGGDLSALTHGHPNSHAAAGVLAATTYWLLRGRSLTEALDSAVHQWPNAQAHLERAVQLGRLSPAGLRPRRRHLAAMSGRGALDTLALALRISVACAGDFVGAVESATEHGGDTATTAVLCGQLIGALRGPTVVPARWRAELPVTGIVEQLAVDAVTEFSSCPDESDRWQQRYPILQTAADRTGKTGYRPPLSGLPQLSAFRNRFLGSVLGGAAGEALGLPITTDSWEEIQNRHGPEGLKNYVPAGHPSGRLGSETQVLLFTTEGLIRANVARRTGQPDITPVRHVQHAYQRWLHTQHLSWARAGGEFLAEAPEPDGWLVEQRALFHARNPGRTMMRTLIAFAKGQQRLGTPQKPVSDSADGSALLRAVAAPLWHPEAEEAFDLGVQLAALTHGHPSAYLSAGTLAFLLSRLLHGTSLQTALDDALDVLGEHQQHSEVSRRLTTAVRLAGGGPVGPEELVRSLGTGWSAPEALAIGVHAALSCGDDYDTALRTAVNHSGNSTLTGAVGGALAGASVGADHIADHWTADLELCEVIEQLAEDALLEFGTWPPRWGDRYPAT